MENPDPLQIFNSKASLTSLKTFTELSIEPSL